MEDEKFLSIGYRSEIWMQMEMPSKKFCSCKMHENVEAAKRSLKAQNGAVYA